MAILDASVLVALFRSVDVHHASARAWFVRATEDSDTMMLPAHTMAEVAGVLRRITGDLAVATAAIAEMGTVDVFTVTPITVPVGMLAARIAGSAGIKGADAIYVALAAELDDVLVTFDAEQLERGAAFARVEMPA